MESPSCGYLYSVSALLFSTWRKKTRLLSLLVSCNEGFKEPGREKDRRSRLVSNPFYSMRDVFVYVSLFLSASS